MAEEPLVKTPAEPRCWKLKPSPWSRNFERMVQILGPIGMFSYGLIWSNSFGLHLGGCWRGERIGNQETHLYCGIQILISVVINGRLCIFPTVMSMAEVFGRNDARGLYFPEFFRGLVYSKMTRYQRREKKNRNPLGIINYI